MKRILFITPFTPDNQGVGVSPTSQLFKQLADGFNIDLVYFRYPEDKPYTPPFDNITVLKECVVSRWKKIKGIMKRPWIFPLFRSRHNNDVEEFLKKQVKKVHYDLLFFDFSQTFSYAESLQHPNKLLMSHDVIAQKYSRMKRYLRPWAVSSERRMLKNGSIIFTFSKKDCELIEELYHVKSKYTNFFLHPFVLQAVPKEESNYFVFFGAWDRIENSEALTWFIDNVYERLPLDIKYKVIGGGKMPNGLKEKIDQRDNIEYLGFVDNPFQIIANARAEIAPLHMGAGVKVKCVEALGSGTPIIGTEVAFEGIGEKYRHAMFEANSAEEYVKTISSFRYSLEDKKKLKDYFLENYNNKQILKYINDL